MGAFEQVLGLFVAAAALAARRVGAPYPVFLALGGAVLGFVPGAPAIALPPEVVLAIFVAPILVVTNAGHPPPMWYRAAQKTWTWLEVDRASTKPAGVPIGLLEDIQYFRRVIKLQPDDLVVLYSDGASEAVNGDGTELGREGLMSLVKDCVVQSAATCGAELGQSLKAFRGSTPANDDQTVMVLRAL